MDDPNSTHPISQAGHHTHHTTTCVHIPHTSQPNAAWVMTVSTDTPVYQQAPRRTMGGESRFSSKSPRVERAYRTGAEPWGRATKLRGAHKRPIMKEREKLRVARVESDKPNRRSAKDLIRRYCCGTMGFDSPSPLESNAARSSGRRTSTTMKM